MTPEINYSVRGSFWVSPREEGPRRTTEHWPSDLWEERILFSTRGRPWQLWKWATADGVIDKWSQPLCSGSTTVLVQKMCFPQAAPRQWLRRQKYENGPISVRKRTLWLEVSPSALQSLLNTNEALALKNWSWTPRVPSLINILRLPFFLRDTTKVCQGDIFLTAISKILSFSLSTGYCSGIFRQVAFNRWEGTIVQN